MKKLLAILVVGGLMCLLPVRTAHAILLGGFDDLGAFTGDLSYDSSLSKLTISLTNTSAPANGGYITAFAFNNPFNSITGASLTASDTDFGLLGGATFNNTVNGSPFGQFDIGASTGGSWSGGGNPSLGIAVGDTETFAFSFSGSGLGSLNSQDFLDTSSEGVGSGEGYQDLAVRFRGFRDGGSDKVPNGGDGPTPDPVVPEPATMILLGSGLLGAGILKKRTI